MTDANRNPTEGWTKGKALILAIICLMVGITGGWMIRGWQAPALTGSAIAAGTASRPAQQQPTNAELKQMADAQAAPLLDKLRADTNNADLLAGIGNIYYDAHQYPVAIGYYGRALHVRPSDAAVRTDMGTAYWFMGNADTAISEFNNALTDSPNNPNTLFNRGLVKWKGKSDPAGAIADWQKLLALNPRYEAKNKVEQMIGEARADSASESGLKSK